MLKIGNECQSGSLSGSCNSRNTCEYDPVLSIAICGKGNDIFLKNLIILTYIKDELQEETLFEETNSSKILLLFNRWIRTNKTKTWNNFYLYNLGAITSW